MPFFLSLNSMMMMMMDSDVCRPADHNEYHMIDAKNVACTVRFWSNTEFWVNEQPNSHITAFNRHKSINSSDSTTECKTNTLSYLHQQRQATGKQRSKARSQNKSSHNQQSNVASWYQDAPDRQTIYMYI